MNVRMTMMVTMKESGKGYGQQGSLTLTHCFDCLTIVYPSDTVVVRLRVLSLAALVGLNGDTTCTVQSVRMKQALLHTNERRRRWG